MRKLSPYLSKANRLNLARRIKTGRKYDRTHQLVNPTWERRRTLSRYSNLMQINLEEKIMNMIISKNRKIKILDIGCGKGNALAEVKNKFETSVETHGLRLTGKTEERFTADLLAQGMIDKLHVGSIENYLFKQKFDLIVSFAGFHYISNVPLGLEKVCNSLTKKGEAILQIPKSRLRKEWIETLRKKGFMIEIKSGKGQFSLLKILNADGKKVNLEKEIKNEAKKHLQRKIDYQKFTS